MEETCGNRLFCASYNDIVSFTGFIFIFIKRQYSISTMFLYNDKELHVKLLNYDGHPLIDFVCQSYL